MKTIDEGLLSHWDEVWRHPEIIAEVKKAELEGGGSAMGVGLDAARVGQSLLRGIAASYTPERAFEELAESGEFAAAEWLLDRPQFLRQVKPQECAAMRARLEEARARASNRVEVRQFELSTRALRAGALNAAPKGLSVVAKRAAAAHALLDGWEREIEQAEAYKQDELRVRLDRTLATKPADTDERRAWRSAVTGYIEKRYFESALRLLNLGEMPDTSFYPNEIPRRSPWPRGRERTPAVVQKFLRGHDPEFTLRWGPTPEDGAARDLLKSLEAYASAASGKNLLRGDAEGFATALDAFLGAAPGADPQLRTWPGGFSAILRAPVEPCVPRLASYGEGGVPLWLPHEPSSSVPEQLLAAGVLVAFHPDSDPIGPELVLKFTSTLLFRLVGDPHRRVNFVRRLARQLNPADIMPPGFAPVETPELTEEAVSKYTAWFFDYHGIDVESGAVLDLIAYYSTAEQDILYPLLGQITDGLRDREEAVTASHVHAAWNSGRFREAAVKSIVGSVADDPWLLTVLGGAYYEVGSEEELTPEDVATALELATGESMQEDVRPALRVLIDSNLVAQGSTEDVVWVPNSPRTMLIHEYLGDIESSIRKHFALVKEKHRRAERDASPTALA